MFLDSNRDITQRITNYIVPPFSHCKLAFLSKERGKGFDMYGITGNGNLEFDVDKTYVDVIGACVLKLQLNELQCNLLRSILSVFVENKERYRMSYWKCTTLEARMRNLLCMGPPAYPSVNTVYWTCSEFVTHCLQQSGVLDTQSLHPTFVSPTHLFLELIVNPRCDILNSYDPMYKVISKRKGHFKSEDDTNAYKVFCKIMNIYDVKEVLKYRLYVMSTSLCQKMRIKIGDISQYGLVNSFMTPNFNVSDYISKKNEDLDTCVIEHVDVESGKMKEMSSVHDSSGITIMSNSMHYSSTSKPLVHSMRPYSNYSDGYNKQYANYPLHS